MRERIDTLATLRRLLLRLRAFIQPSRAERELAREVAAHVELLEEEFLRRGFTPEQARVAARRAMGGIEQAKERQRDVRSFLWLEDARRDVRDAWRGLRRNGVFAAVAVLTLALGIGANTAIFSIVHAVLLKSLPYKDPGRLVRIIENEPAAENRDGRARCIEGLYGPNLRAVQQQTRTLAVVAGYGPELYTVSAMQGPVRLEGASVSPSMLAMLGVQPLIGQLFDPRDDSPTAERFIILSYGTWQSVFGGDPDIVGRTLTLDAGITPGAGNPPRTQTVLGVMPASFQFPNAHTQFWMAAISTSVWAPPVLARLADGVTREAAAAEVASIVFVRRGKTVDAAAVAQRNTPPRFELVDAQDEIVAPVRPALLVLTGAVAIVLLIACVNVANLLLARTAARQREIAVRLALGASRVRIVRQLLTESLLLACAGGAAGTLLAWGGIHLLRRLATTLMRVDLGGSGEGFPRLDEIQLDVSVLAFTLVICLITAMLFGLAPALGGTRAAQMDVLRESRTTGSAGFSLVRRHRGRGLLVIAEIAMAMMLLVSGGLLMHSFIKLITVPLGFDPSRVQTFQVALPPGRYPGEQIKTFAETLTTRLRAMPGVHAAGYATQVPMVALMNRLFVRRTPAAPEPGRRGEDARFVSTDYLKAMGVRLLAGRAFEASDSEGRPRVIVINQTLARQLFPGEGSIGQVVYIDSPKLAEPWSIIGIVEDVRQSGVSQEPEPQLFIDMRQWPGVPPGFAFLQYFALRTEGDPATVLPQVRDVVRQVDPQGAIYNVASMDLIVSNAVARPRMYAVLLGIFASVAVLLAVIGIYGVMAYAVAQRTRELGIRIALGARRAQVLGLVLRQSLALIVIGIALGLSGAAAVTRYLKGLLFGLTPLDTPTFLAVSLTFALVATLASYLPARRATRIDPLIALRDE